MPFFWQELQFFGFYVDFFFEMCQNLSKDFNKRINYGKFLFQS